MDTRDQSEVTENSNAVSSQECETLKASLEEANKKAVENWDLFLRARADADNIRRRAVLDVENAHKYGMERFARELLLVVDSLEQGLLIEQGVAPALKEGMQLTQKLLLDILDKFGIKPVDPLGDTFDPARHEALSTQASEEEPNKILTVVQKGFTLHDRILRPARLIVSRVKGEGD